MRIEDAQELRDNTMPPEPQDKPEPKLEGEDLRLWILEAMSVKRMEE